MKRKNVILLTVFMLSLIFSLQISFAKEVVEELNTTVSNESATENLIVVDKSAKLYLEDDDGTLIPNDTVLKMSGGKKLAIQYEPKKLYSTIIYEIIPVEDEIDVTKKIMFDGVEQDVKDSKGNYKKLYLTLPNITGRVAIRMFGKLTDGTQSFFKNYIFDLTKDNSQESQLTGTMNLFHNGKVMSEKELNIVSENPTFELKYDPISNFDTLQYTKTYLNSDGTVAEIQSGAIYLLVCEGKEMGFDGTIKLDLAIGSLIRLNIGAKLKDGSFISQSYNLKAEKETLKADISLWDNGTLIKNNSKMEIEAGKTLTVNCSPKENVKTVTCKFIPVPDDNGVMIKTYFPPIELDVKSEKKLEIKVPDVAARLKLHIDVTLADGSKVATKEYTFDVVKKVTEVTKAIFEVYYNGKKMENGKTYEVSVDPTFELKCIPEESFDSITYSKTFLNPDGTEAEIQAGAIYLLVDNGENISGFDGKNIKIDLKGSIKWNISAKLKDGTFLRNSYILKVQEETLKADISLWDNGTLIKNNSKMEMEAGKTLTVNCSPKENVKTITYKFVPVPDDNGVMIKTYFPPIELDVKSEKKLEIKVPDVVARLKLHIDATLVDGSKAATKEYTFDVVEKVTEVTKAIFEVYYNGEKMENGKTYEVSVDPTIELKCIPEENFESITYNRVFLNSDGTMASIQENAIYMVNIENGFNGAKLKINLNSSIKWNITATLKDGTFITGSYILTTKKDGLESNISLWDEGKLIRNNSKMEICAGKTLTVNCSPKENFETITYKFVAVPDDNGGMLKTYFEPIKQNVKTAKKLEVTIPVVEGRVKLNIEATLVDGTKSKIKEYIFDIKKAIIEIFEVPWKNISSWAEEELREAFSNHLIPEVLNAKDYTEGVSRSEFASIAVKLYENIAKKEVQLPNNNPFKDTQAEDVLKAYNLGITNGVSETEFAPDKLITREQMATMMTRTLEKLDVKIDVNTENKFADDVEISEWAKNGVYFMNAKGIIKGMENNVFKAKNTATREQALLISNRCMENL